MHMSSTPDSVVVGGGLTGLAAATYLARGGAHVTLVEKAPRVGGRGVSDTPRGYVLDRGAHAVYTGGAASSVFRELGVRYSSGSPKHIFALDAGGLHPFPSDAVSLLSTNALATRDKPELMRVLLRISTLRPANFTSQSVADFINEQTRRSRVRQILTSLARVYVYSTALDIISADLFCRRLQQTLKHPVHYVDGGWQAIVDGLEQAAIAAGVQVRTSSTVASVQIQHGFAQGVQLRDGSQLECSHVVLALTPDESLKVLGQPAAGLQRMVRSSVAAHIACLDLGLSRLPSKDHPVVFDLEKPRFVTSQSEFARLAPEGGAVVHLFKQLDPRAPSDPHSDREDLETFMDQIQPGWRDVVVEHRFLPYMQASSSLPLVATGGLAGRPAHQSSDVPNVYFAGDWVGPRGFLIDAGLDSARVTASVILQDLGAPARAA